MTIEPLSVSQCKSADWCAGYNAAVEKIEELIAADIEYDAAVAALLEQENLDEDDDLYLNALRRKQWAIDRRAHALANLRGETP